MRYPKFIDNDRKSLGEILQQVSPNHDVLNIATGYWDVAGTMQVINEIENYKKLRLLIGKEPLTHRLQKEFKIDLDSPENLFPNADIKHDLEEDGKSSEINQLRDTVRIMAQMIKDGILEVKVFRQPRLHAKAYIFGEIGNGNSVGIIGSSNFTKAGLTSNTELNYLEDDYQRVEFVPTSENQENGHLMWFKNLWESEEAIPWTGDFEKILTESPLGDSTYGPYDVYIRTLMEIFPEELIEPEPFDDYVKEYLHPFQNQNALSLRRKLIENGVAMLSDSVGLGKTVTAAAIIDQYIKEEKDNITLILPASLQNQWIEELESEPWNLRMGRDFTIFTQENISKLEEATEKSLTKKGYEADVNLFVVDEAHNLRNTNSKRYDAVLEYLQANPTSEVLLLTATPINNSLMDFSSQIQLGSKGELSSYKVKYKSSPEARSERLDFFQAAKQIQSAANRAQNRDEKFDWEFHKPTLVSGIRHYLVRSTRQGVEKRQAMKHIEGNDRTFPESHVEQFSYRYSNSERDIIDKNIDKNLKEVFENFDPRRLNLEIMMDITQRTSHPLDIIKRIVNFQNKQQLELGEKFYNLNSDALIDPILVTNKPETTVITTLYRLINLLGFVPYKMDTYAHEFHNKSMEEVNQVIDNTDEKARSYRMQFAIHNMLHTTWLKRLESSATSLLKSVQNYSIRLNAFEEWVNEGYLIKLSDIETLTSEYDGDVEQANAEFEIYKEKLSDALRTGTEESLKKQGVEIKVGNERYYNMEQLQKDINRDKAIISVITGILEDLCTIEHDSKLKSLASNLVQTIDNKKYGEKVLVFSFFADTIEYLREALPKIINKDIYDFDKRAAFISGQTGSTKKVAQLFSPKSQKYILKKGEREIDFLFATDVLSEGQNLQDAGILVNYDLHWNPVRMIQRNGRINRLGSEFDEVLIANARPHDELEEYLKLVNRLENKINAINSTIGTDSSIIGEEINPIEFSDKVEEAYGIYSTDSEKATQAMDELEQEDSVIDWIDDYSMELREFLDSNKPEEIQRIASIPSGKWNYLPKEKDTDQIYGLFKGYGANVATGEKVVNTVFIEYEERAATNFFAAKQSAQPKIVSDEEILKYIKTNPEDNEKSIDTIDANRANYIELGIAETKTNFASKKNLFDIKPRHIRALESLQEYLTEYTDIQGLITNNITRINEQKKFNSLVRDVNREMKQQQRLNFSTVNKAKRLFKELFDKKDHVNNLDQVEGVLFYAPNKSNRQNR